jgi:hypothetical protein
LSNQCRPTARLQIPWRMFFWLCWSSIPGGGASEIIMGLILTPHILYIYLSLSL